MLIFTQAKRGNRAILPRTANKLKLKRKAFGGMGSTTKQCQHHWGAAILNPPYKEPFEQIDEKKGPKHQVCSCAIASRKALSKEPGRAKGKKERIRIASIEKT